MWGGKPGECHRENGCAVNIIRFFFTRLHRSRHLLGFSWLSVISVGSMESDGPSLRPTIVVATTPAPALLPYVSIYDQAT